ncbi:thioesterase domain-containing protein [Streptomyces sp. NPDC005438]|uniref:thioesterase II family protein n=1 Tax=Streptomyces sp. NPDC005438 TaxID=3156880 RepID=UPI0033AD71D5
MSLPELLILHYAGGSAIAYRKLGNQLRGKFRVLMLDLLGRGATYGQKVCRSVREAVGFCLDALDEQGVVPNAVFGRSMGALIAFELASELERRGAPVTWAGSVRRASARISHPAQIRRDLWNGAQLLDFVRDLGGTSEELLENPNYVDYLLEVIRSDLELVDTYVYDAETPLDTPAEVCQGRDTPVLGGIEVGHWKQCFRHSVTGRSWPGGYFYLYGSEGEVANAITTSFDRALERKAGAPQQEASGPNRQENS